MKDSTMNKKVDLQKVSEEIVHFIRGKYALDEVASKYYDIDCLKLRQEKRTILSINFLENRYDCQVVFGKKEREKFEVRREEFSQRVKDIYDNSKTYHDGKWMMFPVTDLETLEDVKQMVLIKKNPNRKPFPKENAVYGKCGHRCDLCIHYTDITDEFREMLIPHLNAVYGVSSWDMRCTGCDTPDCHCCKKGNELCEPLKCISQKDNETCMDCNDYPCDKATVGYKELEHKTISPDDVTWAILPYVPNQYE